MTDDEAKALGLRAVACPGWRWIKGTSLGPDGRHMVIEDDRTEEGLALVNTDKEHTWWMEPDHVAGCGAYTEDGPAWPDFRDHATLGCLLALVREAWGQPYAVALAGEFSRGIGRGRDFGRWSMRGYSPRTGEPVRLAAPEAPCEPDVISGASEAETLVAALKAASARVAT